MNEQDWLGSTDPSEMLTFVQEKGLLSARKARLFAVACCRRVWALMADERSRHAVVVCEQHADGRAGEKKLREARRAAFTPSRFSSPSRPDAEDRSDQSHAAVVALNACMDLKTNRPADLGVATAGCANSLVFHTSGNSAGYAELNVQCELLRDIVGNPYRPFPQLPPALLAWNDATALRLATAAYEHRSLPDGRLDSARLAVLADALEDAGCGDAALLEHLRGPGPHVRGCWAIDLLLGKQ